MYFYYVIFDANYSCEVKEIVLPRLIPLNRGILVLVPSIVNAGRQVPTLGQGLTFGISQ